MTEHQETDGRRILAVVLLPLFMSLLSVSIVNVVLSSISGSIGASTSALQWVLSGYTLAFGVLLVTGGRAGDLFGRGRIFVAGVIVFLVGSLAAGLAPDPLSLNIARVVMGVGSGLLNPQSVGLIQQYFTGAARARAFGAFGSVVGVSVAIGPVLGGALIALAGPDWGWRWSFLVNVPIGVAAVIAAFRVFPASAWHGEIRRRSDGQRVRVDLDPVGNVLLAAALLAVMIPFLEHAVGLWIYALLPLGVLLIVAWVRWEKQYSQRGGSPMVDLDLFATRSFSSGLLLVSLYFTGMTSVWVVMALFLQNGHQFTALQAGVLGLPTAIASAVAANVSGRLITRLGRPLVVAGTVLCVLGLGLSCLVVWLNETHGVSLWWLMLTLVLTGAAQGMVISPNQTLTLAEVPVKYAGSAGGVLQTGQRIGTAIGIALITAVFFFAVDTMDWDRAFVVAFACIATVIIAAGVVGTIDWVIGRRSGSQAGQHEAASASHAAWVECPAEQIVPAVSNEQL